MRTYWILTVIAAVAVGLTSGCGSDCADTLTCESSTSASGGEGGTGGQSGTGGSTTASSGGGGTGPCQLGSSTGCGDGEKCTVLSLEDGTVGCGPAGAKAILERCANDGECAVGTWCDDFTGVCEAICNEPDQSSSCGQGWCRSAAGSGISVPAEISVFDFPDGKGICSSGCNPVGTTSCPAGLICAAWSAKPANEVAFTCAVPSAGNGGLTEDASCDLSINTASCAPGLICAAPGVCLRWCSPIASSCVGGKTCTSFPIPFVENGQEYGACL